jgi:hypothetical protein
MIQSSTIQTAHALAVSLANRGLRLGPQANTPLDTLMKAANYPIAKGNVNKVSVDEEIMLGGTFKDHFGICKHDVVMDEVVGVISKTVRWNLDLSRDVINPIVKQAYAEATEYVNSPKEINAALIEILPVNYHSIWNSPVLSEMVARYQEVEFKEIELTIALTRIPMSRPALLEIAKTGASRFDSEIIELFNSLSDKQIVSTFTRVFGAGGEKRLSAVLKPGDITTLHAYQADPILVHLWARNLLQSPPEGVESSIDLYRSYMADIVSQSGRAVAAVAKRRENAINAKQLVGSWPLGVERVGLMPITIYVNGDVYTSWLEDGGEPDVIFGSFITTKERGYSALLQDKEQYARDWARHYRILSTTQRLEAVNVAIDGIRKAVAHQINTIDSSVVIVSREQLHRKLEEVLGNLGNRFHDKLYESVRRVVCDTLFPHTMGLQILKTIDKVADTYPNIEVREAALLATIELVAVWVAKLCHVDYLTPG